MNRTLIGFKNFYWLRIKSIFSDDPLITWILLDSHSLEKGMSFGKKKPNWGGKKAKRLCKVLGKYLKRNSLNSECINAINILLEYSKDKDSCKDKDLLVDINELHNNYRNKLLFTDAGTIDIEEPPKFDENTITDFFKSRHSVRDFSGVPVTHEEIERALKFAELTPTACNRQSSKVYAVLNKELIRSVIDFQLGSQGWCLNATVLFIITSNKNRFGGGYEKHQELIDGGLFAMNFVMGLHLNHIATCFKMFVRERCLEKKVKALCNIPSNEVPIVLILAGHYKSESVKGVFSHRFKVPCVYLN